MTDGFDYLSALKKRFLLLSLFTFFAVVFVSWFFQRTDWTIGLMLGFFAGILDNVIMFLGIKEGSKSVPEKAFAIMKKNMLKRAVVVVAVIVAAIKGGIHVPALFIAFFLIHLVCLVSIIITAKGESPDAERSEKSVRRTTNN